MMMDAAPLEEAINLSLEAKLEHSQWKIRLSGYEELTKNMQEALDCSGKPFQIAMSLLQKFSEDKNVMCKEKGLEVLFAFFDRYEHAKKHTNSIISSVIECLGSGRSKTQSNAQGLLLLMVEIDTPDLVIVSFTSSFSNDLF